ncbi:hypothetical protein EDB85DRAFT_1897871 [Lactarius pseudohatsudake]|nr:hypothetical protein EDB85DRAFT_1897871 [Lactarius pseudohatsudake]
MAECRCPSSLVAVPCWLGVVVSWRVAGCCALHWGDVAGWWWRGSWHGGESAGGGVLRAALRRRGGSVAAGSWRGGAWRVGRVLRDMAGGRGAILGRRGGLACRVGAARRVGGGGVLQTMLGWGANGGGRVHEWPATSGVSGEKKKTKKKLNIEGLACRVGAARWVGGGGVLGQGRMAWNVQGEQEKKEQKKKKELNVGPKVLCAVLGWRGGLAVAACCEPCQGGVLGWGRIVARVHEGVAMACNVRSG